MAVPSLPDAWETVSWGDAETVLPEEVPQPARPRVIVIPKSTASIFFFILKSSLY